MTWIPPIPSWDSLHPLVVHFPIALLLVAPVFLLTGAARRPENGRPYLIAAFLLMLLGTAGAWLAVATGEATGEAVERTAQVRAVLERHEELAETTRTAFTVLTAIFALILFVPAWLSRENTRLASTVLPLVFAVIYAAGALLLANTAHQGGLLVHELGTSAPMQAAAQADDD